MTDSTITYDRPARKVALDVLNGSADKGIRHWSNGNRLFWEPLSDDDKRPEGFEGLKLVLERQSGRVTAIVSKEQITEDEQGFVIAALINELMQSSLPTG
jgi:hypothetical protein